MSFTNTTAPISYTSSTPLTTFIQKQNNLLPRSLNNEPFVVITPSPLSLKEKEISILNSQLSCGYKHDRLLEIEKVLGKEAVPSFFGFTHDQIYRLLSPTTKGLWEEFKNTAHLFSISKGEKKWMCREDMITVLSQLQKSVEKDILSSTLPWLPTQKKAFESLQGKMVIVRSSSNEDGDVVNAGINRSIGGVEAEESRLKTALAQVVVSYFDLNSLKPHFDIKNEFKHFPLCSVLVMEQIIEDKNDLLPPVSGVMMTSKPEWSGPEETGISHITASWGFGSGTHHRITCDEWVLTQDQIYASIGRKPIRDVTNTRGITEQSNSPFLQNSPCLTDEQLKKLKNIAEQLEAFFKQPMDVEFVFKDDRLYIVQARPHAVPPLTGSTYLDPGSLLNFSTKFQGEMIVPGTYQTIALQHSEIIFAKNLEKAQSMYRSRLHKAVVVYTKEHSNTHPAVNFACQRPSVPCLLLPEEQWKICEKLSSAPYFQLCPQTATLVPVSTPLPSQKGLFLHPLRFIRTIGLENPLQANSAHTSILQLQQLLRAVPEVLETSTIIDSIEQELTKFFAEISQRDVMGERVLKIAKALKTASFDEVDAMKKAVKLKQKTRLAFHAGMLRQLLFPPHASIVGAHSLAALEGATHLPDVIQKFLRQHQSSSLLCELALLGLQGFDTFIQCKWIEFLEKKHDLQKLQHLQKDLQELDALEGLTHWFSAYFCSSLEPPLEELLVKNEIHKKGQSHIAILKNLEQSLKKISSIEALKSFWETLETESRAFCTFCADNHLRQHPFLVDLIELWDVSTKFVRTSRLFSEIEEEELHFKKRVMAFTNFALQLSETSLLKHSLHDLIEKMYLSSSKSHFSVQHWIIPLSHGAGGCLTNYDQWLTVIHQNLLQAASYGNLEHVPHHLKSFYHIFKDNHNSHAKRFPENEGTFISIGKNQSSIRVNIPLNYHSTVVTLSQKKGEEHIEVTVYFRGSDNDRGMHFNFFKILAHLNNILLQESEHVKTDLKIVLRVKTETQMTILSRAINTINQMSLTGNSDIGALYWSMKLTNNPTDSSKAIIRENIGKFLWEELQHSGIFFHLSGADYQESSHLIWNFLEKNNHLSLLVNRVVEEVKGNLPISDFSRKFIKKSLRYLPQETSQELVWQTLIGPQTISEYDIPNNFKDTLFEKLFEQEVVHATRFCQNHHVVPVVFINKMNQHLASKGLTTRNEAALLFSMALFLSKSEIPPTWIQALKGRDHQEIGSFVTEMEEVNLFWYGSKLSKLLTALSYEREYTA